MRSFGLAAILLFTSAAFAGWADNTWSYRRALDVEWELDKVTGDELAMAEFYTGGEHQPSGEHIRVATDDNKYVPCRVLMTGPGDTMRIVFAPVKGVRRHWVYFGNPKPGDAPRGTDTVPIRCGLLMEMKKLNGPLAGNFSQMDQAWQKAGALIGRTMEPTLYLGFNPFGDEVEVMSRYTGVLNAPLDGDYIFAGSASDRAAIYLDGKPLLWIPAMVWDVRFSAKVNLKRGKHDLVAYFQNLTGEQRLSVVWKRPDSLAYELIRHPVFGVMPRVSPGPLEHVSNRPVVADMRIAYVGECFYHEHYSHRYRFTASAGRIVAAAGAGAPPVKYDWEFSDGQTASGPTVDHVFLSDGIYTVKLTVKFGQNTDVRTNRIRVSRLYEHITSPPTDLASAQAKLVAAYEVDKLSPSALPWAALLLERAKEAAALEKVALRLASARQGVEPHFAVHALKVASDELSSQAKFPAAQRVWEAVPPDGLLQPEAARLYGELLMWRIGDFARAVNVIEPQAKKYPANRALQRNYAHALVLSQKPAEGIKLLQSLPVEGPADRQAALTGALARTIEFYISEGDWETGEESWRKWQAQFPADFLEGYSVLLRTQLMEKAKAPEAAAKVAEAFALAMPKSSYAPKLLDRASKLLSKTDAAKSAALRQVLKQKYPEDPLSQ